jgi:hypothetical protein
MAQTATADLNIPSGSSAVGWQAWLGRGLSALTVLALAASASMKLTHNPQVVAQFVSKLGYPESTLSVLGLLELSVIALYAIPRTSVLGAILVTGYLGGAVATHVRLLEPSFVAPLVLGVAAWGGLFLRDARVRTLVPTRKR